MLIFLYSEPHTVPSAKNSFTALESSKTHIPEMPLSVNCISPSVLCIIFPSAKSDTRQNVESIINEYADKSENELMGELMREVAKGRANGTLSNGDIDNFYAQAAPLMTAEQKKKLDNIIGIIKNS